VPRITNAPPHTTSARRGIVPHRPEKGPHRLEIYPHRPEIIAHGRKYARTGTSEARTASIHTRTGRPEHLRPPKFTRTARV
jgi:hypothetical protein